MMVFAMRLELARARALEGWRVGDVEGPSGDKVIEEKLRVYALDMEKTARIGSVSECDCAAVMSPAPFEAKEGRIYTYSHHLSFFPSYLCLSVVLRILCLPPTYILVKPLFSFYSTVFHIPIDQLPHPLHPLQRRLSSCGVWLTTFPT
jgi:hypothetical protein